MKIRNKPLRSLIHIVFFIILVIISSVTPRSFITFNAAILIGEILQSSPIIEAQTAAPEVVVGRKDGSDPPVVDVEVEEEGYFLYGTV